MNSIYLLIFLIVLLIIFIYILLYIAFNEEKKIDKYYKYKIRYYSEFDKKLLLLKHQKKIILRKKVILACYRFLARIKRTV